MFNQIKELLLRTIDDVVLTDDQKIEKVIEERYQHLKRREAGKTLILLLDYMEIMQHFENGLENDDVIADSSYKQYSVPVVPMEANMNYMMNNGGGVEEEPSEQAEAAPPEKKSTVPEMIDYLFHRGAQYGYHLGAVFGNSQQLEEKTLPKSVVRHRIFFRSARDDVLFRVKTFEAGIIESLPDFTFRYSGDLDAASYRPYLHEGVTIENWTVKDGKIVSADSPDGQEDDYLE